MFALHQSVKVLVKLFQKLAGLGGAHKNGAFFLPSFFFAPLVPKKKRYCGILCFLDGEENFLKKAFLPRTPSFKNFETGGLFFIVISTLDGRTHNVRTAPKYESFGQAFSKACEGLGRVAPQKRHFLFAKLFLCASRAKEKAGLWIICSYHN